MKAVDKAKELVDRFLDVDDGIDYGSCCGVTLYQAKQSALICVDEMLSIYDDEGYDSEDYKIVYLEEVKQEINKQ
jgi:hypothetical protein